MKRERPSMMRPTPPSAAAAVTCLLASFFLARAAASAEAATHPSAAFSCCCAPSPLLRRALLPRNHCPSHVPPTSTLSACEYRPPPPTHGSSRWARSVSSSLSGRANREDTDDTPEDNRDDHSSRAENSAGSNNVRGWFSATAATLTLLFAAMFVAPTPPSALATSSDPTVAPANPAVVTTAAVSSTTTSSASASLVDPALPPQPKRLRYYTIMHSGTPTEISSANEALLDTAVGTINAIYYDNSAGINFTPRDLYDKWRALRVYAKEGRGGLVRLRERDRERGEDRTSWMYSRRDSNEDGVAAATAPMPEDAFSSRTKAVEGLRWIVSTLNDPFSMYLTREELWEELHGRGSDGFLGLGAMVGPPQRGPVAIQQTQAQQRQAQQSLQSSSSGSRGMRLGGSSKSSLWPYASSSTKILTPTRVENLPIVTAVTPDSPAERAGITVGDRIVAVGDDKFVGSRREVSRKLNGRYRAENYIGYPDLTVAKPVVRAMVVRNTDANTNAKDENEWDGSDSTTSWRETVVGYRQTRVRLPTRLVEPFRPYVPPSEPAMIRSASSSGGGSGAGAAPARPIASGGDAVVHYELLTPSDSIFRRTASSEPYNDVAGIDSLDGGGSGGGGGNTDPVGYIRLTRFSRTATAGYLHAISELESAGAKSYILDVRNNYGGIIQEAMLTASTLLRDPKTVLCYTMNSRGGFTPHSVEDFVRDERYPGYLLSRESSSVTLDQVRNIGGSDEEEEREDGIMWVPSTSYSSLHEQSVKKGIRRASASASSSVSVPPRSASLGYVGSFANTLGLTSSVGGSAGGNHDARARQMHTAKDQRLAQKKIVVLVNEGTASSAEMFAAALRDNGRTVALVGAKTYGKGLIQHTFPMPDGGALRLTIAEYLTPNLKHVTNVGGARFDPQTGELVGGGIRPDVYCPSKYGIPSNVGADFCVGVALDALEAADIVDDDDDGERGREEGGVSFGAPSVTIASKREGLDMSADTSKSVRKSSGYLGAIPKYQF